MHCRPGGVALLGWEGQENRSLPISADTVYRKQWPFLQKRFSFLIRALLLATLVTNIVNNSYRPTSERFLPNCKGKTLAFSLSLWTIIGIYSINIYEVLITNQALYQLLRFLRLIAQALRIWQYKLEVKENTFWIPSRVPQALPEVEWGWPGTWL